MVDQLITPSKTEYTQLRLVMGVPKLPEFNNTSEAGISIVNLNAGGNGFNIDPSRPWNPVIPTLKDRWVNSVGVDGRLLDSNTVGNVVETVNLILHEDDRQIIASYIRELNRFITRARSYWATYGEIEPVYLDFKALGAPGHQYAMIYNIECSYDWGHGLPFEQDSVLVTLVIEREPAWRGIAPGLPPTLWTRYSLGQVFGKDYVYTDLSLIDDTALISETINNKHEWGTGTYQNATAITKNYITIEADNIPGDAPALLSVGMKYSYTNLDYPRGFYMAKSTKPVSVISAQGGQIIRRFQTLAGGDSLTNGVKTSVTDVRGVVSNGAAAGTYYEVECAATTTYTMEWGLTGSEYAMLLNNWRGRYAIFARFGAPTDTTLQLKYATDPNATDDARWIAITDIITNPTASVTEGDRFSVYLGTITIPIDERQAIDADGTGLRVDRINQTGESDFGLRLEFITAQSISTNEFTDLVLLPIDEGLVFVDVAATSGNDPDADGDVLYDNTGYLNHGMAHGIVQVVNHTEYEGHELSGGDIMLTPGIDNQLYFMFTASDSSLGGVPQAVLEDTFDIRINIIPRWYGVRDV